MQEKKNLVRGIFVVTMITVFALACSSSTLFTQPTPIETPIVTVTPVTPSLTSTSAPPSATAVPTLGIGSTWIRPADDAVMLYIPDGDFIMGSDIGGSDEKPQHTVHLIDYWIDRTEITNGMYQRCIDAGVCTHLGTAQRSSQYDDYPAAQIGWQDAQNYCAWVDARLPTEAEWEKAGRGTDGRMYAWGDELDPTKYYFEPQPKRFSPLLKPAGSYPSGASPYGVLDMTGSVFEWVNDLYSATYYATSSLSNPVGPAVDTHDHVFRGGNYNDYDFRIFVRSAPVESGWNVNANIGFRCAMDTDS